MVQTRRQRRYVDSRKAYGNTLVVGSPQANASETTSHSTQPGRLKSTPQLHSRAGEGDRRAPRCWRRAATGHRLWAISCKGWRAHPTPWHASPWQSPRGMETHVHRHPYAPAHSGFVHNGRNPEIIQMSPTDIPGTSKLVCPYKRMPLGVTETTCSAALTNAERG